MIIAYTFLHNILLRVTPTAKRNTYSVATPYYIYTQGRGAARLNPGLGNRNSYRVAAGCGLYPHLATCVLLNYSNTHRSAPSSPCLLQPTPTPTPSSPRLHLPTTPLTPSSPHLLQYTPTPASSTPHLLQPTPPPAPSSPRLHLPPTPPTPSTPRLHLPTTPPTPSSPHLLQHTPTPTPSTPRLHHTACGNRTALFLQKWG